MVEQNNKQTNIPFYILEYMFLENIYETNDAMINMTATSLTLINFMVMAMIIPITLKHECSEWMVDAMRCDGMRSDLK